MTTLLSIILITGIWCLGITIVTQPDMGLGFIRVWAESKKSKWFEPLILCPWCLPSVHSMFGYFFGWILGFNITWNIIMVYPLVVAGASVVSGTVWTICEYLFIKTKYFSHIEKLSYFDLKDRKRGYYNDSKK